MTQAEVIHAVDEVPFTPTMPTILNEPPEFVLTKAEDALIVPGRRSFLEFVDFGLRQATHGQVSAQVIRASQALSQPTGWHYHTVEMQITYVVQGWFDAEFENGYSGRLTPGSFIMLPGGYRHNEIRTSDDLTVFEMVVGEMDTVLCDAP